MILGLCEGQLLIQLLSSVLREISSVSVVIQHVKLQLAFGFQFIRIYDHQFRESS